LVIKPLEEDSTPGTVKPFQVSLVEPVAYQFQLDKGEVHRAFYTLSRQIGLRGVDDSRGPRLHDFRHRFAVQTLLRWYRNGEDPKRRLPILSTYLGHAHVTDTYWYLTGTPELLRAAGDRLEKRWEGLNAGLR
jgi:integrase